MRVQLRLAYEMNRQLLADSGMSLPDYDVLTQPSLTLTGAAHGKDSHGQRDGDDGIRAP
jgi:hypothetical protein